jgi:signal transduction histidine kinase
MTNLIKNAMQATEDIYDAEIKIEVKETTNNAIIKVSDNGVGISQDIINRIFEPQFTTKNAGMGLGLSMVKKIINTHKGKIEVESKLNTFTTFIITLPKTK